MNRISYYSEQIRGVSYKPEDVVNILDDTSVLLLRANNIRNGQINFDDVVYVKRNKVSDKQMLRKGDILICASSGSKDLVGKAAQINFDVDCTFGAFCKVVRPRDIHHGFLGMYFQSNKYRRTISQASAGANINNIKNEDIDCLEIEVPGFETQKEIYEVLSKTYNVIYARAEELLELDNLIKSRFVEMFGDVITNDKQWGKLEWSQALNIVNGKNQKTVECADGEYLICGSGGPMGRARDYLVRENSVIIGRKGNINKPILMREKFWNVDTAFGLEPDAEKIVVEYLYYFCEFYDFERLNKAVTIPSLTKSDLQKIEMPIPNIELQKTFTDFVQQVDKLKFEVQKSLDETQQLMDSLMQQYFG